MVAASEGRQSLFVTVTVKEGKMPEYEEVNTRTPCYSTSLRPFLISSLIIYMIRACKLRRLDP